MSPEAETVVDVFYAGDADVPELITTEDLARHWQCHPTSARTYLLAAGVRLVRVYGKGDSRLRVRLSDVHALEKALTVYLQPFKRPPTNRARSYAKNLTI